jgi:hypothetical protein
MRDLSVVMESLRLVQRARRRFVELSAIEKDVINPMLDRMAEDLRQAPGTAEPGGGDACGPAGLNPLTAADEER